MRRLVPRRTDGWAAAGVDEFLRAYLSRAGGRPSTPRRATSTWTSRTARKGSGPRLETLSADSLFVWGRKDTLVPIGFMKHVEKALPEASHVELPCGHVPQVERAARDARGDQKVPGWYNVGVSFPPGPRMPSLMQAAFVTASPYGWMVKRWRKLRGRLLVTVPDLRPRGLRGRPGAREGGLLRRPDRLPRRRGQRLWPSATRSASTRC